MGIVEQWEHALVDSGKIQAGPGGKRFIKVGSFENKSGQLLVCDPAVKDKEHGTTIDNCLPGNWHAFVEVGSSATDNLKFFAFHDNGRAFLSSWQLSGKHCDVDSGVAGFFDLAQYNISDEFYETIGLAVEGKAAPAIKDKQEGLWAWAFAWGAVASTATGDGTYNCYVLKDGEKVVGVGLVFFAEEPSDDDDIAGDDDVSDSDSDDDDDDLIDEDDEVDADMLEAQSWDYVNLSALKA